MKYCHKSSFKVLINQPILIQYVNIILVYVDKMFKLVIIPL